MNRSRFLLGLVLLRRKPVRHLVKSLFPNSLKKAQKRLRAWRSSLAASAALANRAKALSYEQVPLFFLSLSPPLRFGAPSSSPSSLSDQETQPQRIEVKIGQGKHGRQARFTGGSNAIVKNKAPNPRRFIGNHPLQKAWIDDKYLVSDGFHPSSARN